MRKYLKVFIIISTIFFLFSNCSKNKIDEPVYEGKIILTLIPSKVEGRLNLEPIYHFVSNGQKYSLFLSEGYTEIINIDTTGSKIKFKSGVTMKYQTKEIFANILFILGDNMKYQIKGIIDSTKSPKVIKASYVMLLE